MQDIHSIGNGNGGGGGGGRFFSGGGGDRRLRPHHHQNHQALKCPRCDSLNTKFCYYNNYNLSQPRHFCKSCRRYWTKGGVLRNVPVGGGCRKTKRSKPKQTTADATTIPNTTTTAANATTTTTAPPAPPQQQEREIIKSSSNSHSSSESSSLTATNTTAGIEAVSGHSSVNSSTVINGMGGGGDSKLYLHQNNINTTSSFENGLLEQQTAAAAAGGSDSGNIFPEIGSFTSLITSSTSDHLQFGFGNLITQQHHHQQNLEHLHHNFMLQQQQQNNKMVVGMNIGEEMKMQEINGGFDQTVHVELSGLQSSSRSGNGGGFGSLDWQGNGDQGLFDLPSGVDHSYWSQSHWTDNDQPSLYLP